MEMFKAIGQTLVTMVFVVRMANIWQRPLSKPEQFVALLIIVATSMRYMLEGWEAVLIKKEQKGKRNVEPPQ